jgi:benzoate membrane transport protein
LRFSEVKAPLLAGTVASITGTAASIGVVLSAFQALGASEAQTATAIFVMLISYGVLSIALSWRFRMPISIVWSTPGAALLVASGTLGLGFANATGAFLVTGLLIALTGLWPALGRLVSSIPKPIASAMLAGVIFPFCIAPFQALGEYSGAIVPALLLWLVLYRFATVWAAPAAIATAFVLISVQLQVSLPVANLLPALTPIQPSFDLLAVVGVAVPLYLVTMASQNIPGFAIMKSFGFEVPSRAALVSTGLGTVIGSFFGGFALNLAAITAALNANEHAHKDPNRRWLASVFGGVLYLLLAFAVAPIVGYVLAVPRVLILALAGIALFSTILSALSSSVEETDLRLPAVITFLVGASGLALFSIGPGFWALLSGVLVWLALRKPASKTSS